MMYPHVTDLAAEGYPVAVTCRVLRFSKQAYYRWLSNPVSQRDFDHAHVINACIDAHHDNPTFGYRFIKDELETVGSWRRRTGSTGCAPWPACGRPMPVSGV